MRDVQATIDRLAQFQIDSVNIVARAHYLPLFSRLGPYDIELLHRAAQRPPRRLFEYWGHEASLIDVTPAAGAALADGGRSRGGAGAGCSGSRPSTRSWSSEVRAEVAARGPLTAREIEHQEERRARPLGVELVVGQDLPGVAVLAGEITAAGRNRQFERLYDLTERVLPPAVVATPTPSRDEADVALVRRAAQALGVGTLRCLADYFRISTARPARARSTCWSRPASWCRWPFPAGPRPVCSSGTPPGFRGGSRPEPCSARSTRWSSSAARLEQLFDFRYRIEVYVPPAKRVHGYYVYPFLLDSAMVGPGGSQGRPGAGCAAGQLGLAGAGSGPGEDLLRPCPPSWRTMAGWLGLDGVEVVPHGDLGPMPRVGLRRDGLPWGSRPVLRRDGFVASAPVRLDRARPVPIE